MISDAEPNVQDAILGWSIAKSRLLGYGESQKWAITLYQKYFESLLDGITKNDADSMFARADEHAAAVG